MKRFFIGILGLLISCSASAANVNGDTEQGLTEQLTRLLSQGTAVSLQVGDHNAFAIFSETITGSTQGGIIMLHDNGAHADWPAVIAPLRKGLPQFGWSTLSLQLPQVTDQPGYSAALDEIFPRIKAAVAFLQAKGIDNIVIIGDGMGAIAAAAYAASVDSAQVKAFVGVNVGVFKDADAKVNTLTLIEKITMPMLDIFGTNARLAVVNSAQARATAAKKAGINAFQSQKLETFKQSAVARTPFVEKTGYIAYRQMKIMGADSSFTAMEDLLLKRILGWLRKHAPGITVTLKE